MLEPIERRNLFAALFFFFLQISVRNQEAFIHSGGGDGLLTVRRLKANCCWLAAPSVTTVTRCLSSRTIVNCMETVPKFRHRHRRTAVQGGGGSRTGWKRTVTATERQQDALLPAARAHSAYSGSLAPISAAATCSSSSSGSFCCLGTATLSLLNRMRGE
jgi:hypothetical protein